MQLWKSRPHTYRLDARTVTYSLPPHQVATLCVGGFMYNYKAGSRFSFGSRWVCFICSLQNISPAGWFWSGTPWSCRHCLCENHFVFVSCFFVCLFVDKHFCCCFFFLPTCQSFCQRKTFPFSCSDACLWCSGHSCSLLCLLYFQFCFLTCLVHFRHWQWLPTVLSVYCEDSHIFWQYIVKFIFWKSVERHMFYTF